MAITNLHLVLYIHTCTYSIVVDLYSTYNPQEQEGKTWKQLNKQLSENEVSELGRSSSKLNFLGPSVHSWNSQSCVKLIQNSCLLLYKSFESLGPGVLFSKWRDWFTWSLSSTVYPGIVLPFLIFLFFSVSSIYILHCSATEPSRKKKLT